MTFGELEEGSHFKIGESRYIKVKARQDGDCLIWGFRLGRKTSLLNAISYEGSPAIIPGEQSVCPASVEIISV